MPMGESPAAWGFLLLVAIIWAVRALKKLSNFEDAEKVRKEKEWREENADTRTVHLQ